MSNNTLTVVETVNAVTVTPIKNTVTVSSVGVQGATGATGAAGITPALKKTTGNYYRTPVSNRATFAAVNQRVYYTPILIDSTTSFDRLAFHTGATFVGTASVRLGIFNDSNGNPSTVVLDAGTVSATAASTVYEITINQSLNAGFYWLAFCQQSAPTTAGYLGLTGDANSPNFYISGAATPASVMIIGQFQSGVTGAFSTAASLSQATATVYTWIRAA